MYHGLVGQQTRVWQTSVGQTYIISRTSHYIKYQNPKQNFKSDDSNSTAASFCWESNFQLHVAGLDLTFIVETDVFGSMQEIELKCDGSKILVDEVMQ